MSEISYLTCRLSSFHVFFFHRFRGIHVRYEGEAQMRRSENRGQPSWERENFPTNSQDFEIFFPQPSPRSQHPPPAISSFLLSFREHLYLFYALSSCSLDSMGKFDEMAKWLSDFLSSFPRFTDLSPSCRTLTSLLLPDRKTKPFSKSIYFT